jgi:hypothetical protein
MFSFIYCKMVHNDLLISLTISVHLPSHLLSYNNMRTDKQCNEIFYWEILQRFVGTIQFFLMVINSNEEFMLRNRQFSIPI